MSDTDKYEEDITEIVIPHRLRGVSLPDLANDLQNEVKQLQNEVKRLREGILLILDNNLNPYIADALQELIE